MKQKSWRRYNLPKKGVIAKKSLHLLLLQAPDPMPFKLLGNFLERESEGQFKMVKVEEK
jgi:hypothetical protein